MTLKIRNATRFFVTPLTCLCILMCNCTKASASNKFSIFGIYGYSNPSYSPAKTEAVKAKTGMGAGLGYEFALSKMFGIETGLSYFQRKYIDFINFEDSNQTVTLSGTTIQFPLLLRIWLTQIFTASAGGYLATGYGSVVCATDASSNSFKYGELWMRNIEYGALGSFGINFPLNDTQTTLILELRYAMGMNNTATVSSPKRKMSDTQAIIGLRFGGFTEKQ